MDALELKSRVRKYWDEHPSDAAAGTGYAEGSLEFYEAIEEWRYGWQAFIHSQAQFSRWRGKKVLEVGCGIGTDLLQFARTGAEAYAIDLSQHSAELTRKRLKLYGLQAEVIHGDGEDLPFPSNYFDLVYCWGVLHHTPVPHKMADEIYRVLKPGGCLKAMVHYRGSPVWLKIWFQYAFLKGRLLTSLSQVISEHVESPGTRAFTMKEIENFFYQFSELKFQPAPLLELEFLRGHRLFCWLADLYPHKFAAWMAVDGRKPSGLEHK